MISKRRVRTGLRLPGAVARNAARTPGRRGHDGAVGERKQDVPDTIGVDVDGPGDARDRTLDDVAVRPRGGRGQREPRLIPRPSVHDVHALGLRD